MTHDELVERAARWLRNTRKCAAVFTEPIAWKVREVPDAIGFDASGRSIVVECKTVRSDFHGDQQKVSRRSARNGGPALGDERWYLAGPGVIAASDSLHGWGLLELKGDRCYRRSAPTHEPSDGVAERALLVALARRGDEPWGGENTERPAAETSRLTFRLPADEHAKMKAAVAGAGETIEAVGRRWVRAYLASPGHETCRPLTQQEIQEARVLADDPTAAEKERQP
ncbi:MAG: hypothetical protein GY719_26215 [bacterium]|nr:hypothetical protein [bacterium]